MSKPKILVQLDTDPQPSVFDGVVAIDAGVEQLFSRADVNLQNVRELVFGAIFTRGGDDLKRTALFVGGTNVSAGDALVAAIRRVFFGPLRVSVMVDSNGANTTAAAAVLAAARHQELAGATALVLGGTGPVGQRVVRLLARQETKVRVGSRDLARAEAVAETTRQRAPDALLEPLQIASPQQAAAALVDAQVIVAAGAAGAQLLTTDARASAASLRVAIDLNAVPPVGLEGIESTDHGQQREGAICYGAIGVGRTKMKIHKRAIQRLFDQNDLILDAEEIFELGRQLEQ